jgi:hypothetical protein
MDALFHSDLLNFGTVIIAVMIVGGIAVALTMFAESVWSIRRYGDWQDEQPTLALKPKEQEGKHLPKSA